MLEVGSAFLTILPSAKGFGSRLEAETSREIDRAGKNTGKRFSDGMTGAAGQGAAKMGGAMKAGLAGLAAGVGIGIFKGLIDDAEESAKVAAKTGAIIKATGGAAKISADQIGALATSISNKTAVDDELIQTGSNMILTFKNVRNEAGKSNDVFNRATQAAVDLSSAGFGSVEGASVMLGKALNDPIKGISALGRAGVTFTAQQKTQITTLAKTGDMLGAQKIILKEVEGQVGGTAAASATGSEKMAVAWGNFREEMGAKLLPAFNGLVDLLVNTVFPAFSQMADYVTNVVAPAISRFWTQTVQPAMVAIGTAVKEAWEGWIKPALTSLWAFIKDVLIPTFQNLWTDHVRPVMEAVGSAVKDAWEGVIQPALEALWAFIKNILAPVISWLATNIVVPLFKIISTAISFAWNSVIRPVFAALHSFVKNILAPVLTWLWKNVVQPVFNVIGKIISTVWTKVIAPVFSKFASVVRALPGAFDTAKRAIGAIWNGLINVVKKPIEFVVNTIFRDGIVKAWNAIASKVGLPQWKFQGMSTSPAPTGKMYAPLNTKGVRTTGTYAQGGWTGPGMTYAPAGVVHADEFVIRKDSQRSLSRRYPGLLDHLNSTGTLPGDGYAKGGMVYPSLISWIHKYLPGAAITSSYRPGSITASGNRSNHSLGRAVDLTPSMANFNKILATFGPSIAELIYTPAGGRQIKNGRNYIYPPNVAAGHYNHIHWAMAKAIGNVPLGAGADMMPGDAFATGADPIGEGLKRVLSGIFGPARGMIGKIGSLFGKNAFAQMATKLATKPVDSVEAWLKDRIDETFPPVEGSGFLAGTPTGDQMTSVGGGVSRWKDTVLKALGMVGQPASLLPSVLRRMQQESGGNPTAINNWDSNAKRGTPSKGLMQVIEPTFRANMMPGYDQIWAPLDNILASMRYAMRTYGSLSRAYNRKGGYAGGGLVPELYDTGGTLKPGLTLVSNQTGKDETVRTAEQEMALRERLSGNGRNGIVINGIRHDSVPEFAAALDFAMTRRANRARVSA